MSQMRGPQNQIEKGYEGSDAKTILRDKSSKLNLNVNYSASKIDSERKRVIKLQRPSCQCTYI